MRILLTNDDGPYAKGLCALAAAMDGLGEIVIVVPQSEVSACGRAITLHGPLHIMQAELPGLGKVHLVDGTPSDCVKLAIHQILHRRPDLILSGINLGSNFGTDVIYSGTVAAAGEGALVGIPSVAISLVVERGPDESQDLGPAACFSRRIAEILLSSSLPKGTFLNVNVPSGSQRDKGVVVTRQGHAGFEEDYDAMSCPRGRQYYWLAGKMGPGTQDPACDDEAIRQGKISVTPLCHDMTDCAFLEKIKEWRWGNQETCPP